MVLVQFAVDGEGQYLGTTKNTPASMHHTMKDLWKLLVHDGVITQVRTKVLLSLLFLSPFPTSPPPTHTPSTPQHDKCGITGTPGPLERHNICWPQKALHYWLFSGSRISGVR